MNLNQHPSTEVAKKVSSLQLMRRARYKVGVNTKVTSAAENNL